MQQAQGQTASESAGVRKTKESSDSPEDWTTVSVDEYIIDEFQVSSKTTDNCVEPTISQSIVVKKEIVSIQSLIGWCKRQRSPETRTRSTSRKHEAESGLENFRVVV